MQEGTVSQGTTQAGTGEAAPLLPIQEGFWIWGWEKKRQGCPVQDTLGSWLGGLECVQLQPGRAAQWRGSQ